MISEEGAVHLAREAIEGAVTLPDDAVVRVTSEEGRYVVEFLQANPPNVPRSDYEARVTIDANSGKVLEILGG